MNKKKILVIITISFLLITNLYTVLKVIKYRKLLKQPPLIEHIYSKIANEMHFNSPIVFTGNSMIHRMNWNWIFNDINNLERPTPIIFNRGIGGNTTVDIKRRLKDNILKLNPKAIFIEIGTNDLKNTTLENRNQKINTVINNYDKIINSIFKYDNKIKVYIISILPVLKNKVRNEAAIEINNKLKIKSKITDNLYFIDCYQYFTLNDKVHANPELFLGEGSAHLNDIGYKKWAEILLPYVLKENDK